MPAPTAAPGSPFPLLAGFGGGPSPPAQRPGPPDPPRRPHPLPIVAVLLSAGLLLAAAVTSSRRSAPELSRQRTAIEAQIAAQTKEVAGLVAARQRLRHQIATARVAATSTGAASRAAETARRQLAPVAGAAAVAGPGVTVRLGDPTDGGSAHRITDSDLAQVVNELWASGAEAVAVNNVRLTARSAIRSAGEAVLVNFRPLLPPYRVTAIGSPDALTTGFANSAIAARLRTASAVYGLAMSVSVADRLALPGASRLPLSIARPAARPATPARTPR